MDIILTFQSLELDNEDLQAEVECLLPQLREVDGVEEVALIDVKLPPDGSKSGGGFVLGALKFVVNNSKIIQGLMGLSNALLGNKTLKMTVKAPDGSEFSGEAKNRDDLEYLLQQAEEFYQRREQKQP
ncbi:sugar ABC transporter permease [Leptolyngbya sp. FACHB-711]|uniref:sugar ABC transporter permease n=1 Tax=Leptolyngbya sp. FACHB-711 TaxID=2692813 RepID=UPI001682E119|nr:sugar ABC transporter permease [Leptolyngbya sp. FACHB-711]MBD1848468.1 sugar ABC transporter permease [Cyanobacteria bacterium FACHB-502]MBD2028196.1 sugar ABC transporter permease [Leptolyngbya sp. FACHB-711]